MRILKPHLFVSCIQVVVAVLGTVGILTGTQMTGLEMGLGALLVLAGSLVPAAVHTAITRRHAARQVRAALTAAKSLSPEADSPPST